MGDILTAAEAEAINNSSPAAQNVQLGTKIRNAQTGVIEAGSIATADIADNAITGAKILDGEVDTADIAADAITSAKILDGEVASADIAANAVTLAKLATGLLIGVDGAIEDAKTTSRDENIDGLSSAIALANSLKTITDAHAVDAAEHTSGADTTNYPIVAADATDLTDLITLVTELLTAYDAHDADAELAGAWAFHVAQEAGDHSLASAVAPTTLNECITRLNDLKAKYNAHDADGTAHTTGSTHQEATADAALGVAILVTEANVLSGDHVVWSILDSGTGTVVGVSGVAGAGTITFTFDADPQDDAVITYAVFRAAS